MENQTVRLASRPSRFQARKSRTNEGIRPEKRSLTAKHAGTNGFAVGAQRKTR